MKTHRLLCAVITAGVLLLGTQAYADSPREDIVHAYVLLKMANNDYAGHRGNAIKELEKAGQELGLDLHGHGQEHERQMQSDAQMAEAGRILREARDRLDAHDREHAAAHVDRAMREIDRALHIR